MQLQRTNYSSGAPLEAVAGYSRVVRTGPFIFVGGTTSVLPDGTVFGEGNSYGQMRYILEKLIGFVEKAGGAKEDIISVKSYVTEEFDASEGSKAYAELLRDIRPLHTMVTVEALNRPTQLVEVEMTAISGCSIGAEWEGITLRRENFSSGSPLEESIGYSRMVKVGPFVYVGGTTSVLPDKSVYGEGDSDAQDDFILRKELDLLALVGASPADVVKTKMYTTREYDLFYKGSGKIWATFLKPVKPLCTGVTIKKLTRPVQLTEIEMTAIVGCGGDAILPEWGNIDFRRVNLSSGAPAEESFGYSRVVKTGPFIFCGGTTSVQPDKSVLFENDSVGQDSYIFEKLLRLIEPLGATPEDVVKVKAYHTPVYKEHKNTDTPSYYAATLSPVRPLYTAVTITKLARPSQLTEIELTAVVGCGQKKAED